MAQKRPHLANGLEAGPTPNKVPTPNTQSPESFTGKLLYQDNKIRLLEAELEAANRRALEYKREINSLQAAHADDLKKIECLNQFRQAEPIRDAIPIVDKAPELAPAVEVEAAEPPETPPEILPLDHPKFKSQKLMTNILVRTISKVSRDLMLHHKYHKFVITEDTNLPDCFDANEMHERFQRMLHITNKEPCRPNDFGPYSIPHRPQLKLLPRIQTEDISCRVPIWMAIHAEKGALLYFPNNERNGKPMIMTPVIQPPKVVQENTFAKSTKEFDVSYKLLNFFSKSHI